MISICFLLFLVLGMGRLAEAQATFAGSQFALAVGAWVTPASVTVDGQGNLFVADRGNNALIELPVGVAGFAAPVTILGGLSNPSALAMDAKGNLYVADTGNRRILMLPAWQGGFGSPIAVVSGASAPAGMAFDSAGNLFYADSQANEVMEAPLAAGMYGAPVVVGRGFSSPTGVAFDATHDLVIADTGNRRVVKQPYASGVYSAPVVMWNSLTPVAVWNDKSGDLYIVDAGSDQVMEDPWLSTLTRYTGLVPVGSSFTSPSGVVVDLHGNVYVADMGKGQVVEIVSSVRPFGATNAGTDTTPITYNFTLTAGTSLGGANVLTQGAAGKDFLDAGGSTCVAQTYATKTNCGVTVEFSPLGSGARTGAIELLDSSDNVLVTTFLSGTGIAPRAMFVPGAKTILAAQLSGPSGVAVDGNGNVYISDTGNNRVVELPWTGSGYGSQMVLPITGLNGPAGLAIDGAGDLYVASYGNDRVMRLPWLGNGYGRQTRVGTGLYGPSTIATDLQGYVYIAATLEQALIKLPWTGTQFGAESGLGDYIKTPVGIAVDSAGNVIFSSSYTNVIAKVPWAGAAYGVQTGIGTVQMSFPTALAVDGNANLYILDTNNNRVLMLPWRGSAYGAQITVASGFNAPLGLALDGQGALYVADTGNNRVVKIDLSTPGTLNFASTYIGSTSADSARTAMVQNAGNASLNLGAIQYPADFPEAAASTCVAELSLNAGTGCVLEVDFTPSSPGSPLSEPLTISDDVSGNAGGLAFTLTGTALAKLAQNISFPSVPGAIYGAAPILLAATASSGLPVSYQVISGPGVLVHNGPSLRLTGAGTVVIQATQAGNSGYQAATPAMLRVTVAPATLTLTPNNTTAIYGSLPKSFSYTIQGFVNGDNPGTATSGQPALSSTATGTSAVGSYAITASPGTLAAANYVFAFATGTLTVNRATLQVNAVSVSHSYGTPMPMLAWKMTGFVNGETASVVSGAPVLTMVANSGSPVGTYPILASVGTLAAANYTFVANGAKITVVPAILTVTATSASVIYGQALPALKYSIAGFVNGDAAEVVQGAPALSTTAVSGSNVGSYPIVCGLGTLVAANYIFKLVNGTLAVQKASLWVAPGSVMIPYGTTVPALSYSLSGFANGDTAAIVVTGTPSLSTSASSRSKPGSYLISATTGSLVAKNYSFNFGSGTVTIGKGTLTVTAQPVTVNYGANLPNLVPSYSGFVNGDSPSSALSGAPSLTTIAAAGSPAGTYPIVTAIGSLSSPLYNLTLANATLTIQPAALTVKAASVSMVYGNPLPALSYTLAGFVNGDTAAVVSGTPALSCSAGSLPSAGVYPVTISAGSMTAANYSFQFKGGTVTVTQAPLTLTANSLSVPVGGAMPAFTYAAAGLIHGDTLASATTGAPVLSTGANMAQAGPYPILIAKGTMAAANYQLTFVNGVLTIKPLAGTAIAKPAPRPPKIRNTGSGARLAP